MQIGSISLSHVAWVPNDIFDSGFKGKTRYLRIGSIVVILHPSATKEDVFKSLLVCAKKLKEGGEIVG